MIQNPSRRDLAGVFAGLLMPASLAAQRRRRRAVVVRRSRIVVHPGHPIRRSARISVVVRPPRRVVVSAPLVFLSVITFGAVAMALPQRERLIWQDTDTIDRDEDWVESNFGVDDRGDALFLQVEGRLQLDFMDVTYENGEVQVVDFEERFYTNQTFRLYEIPGVRNVKTVRLVARARSDAATLRLYMSR